MTDTSAFGARLREERNKLNLSQTDFAALGGVRKQAQINYESGKRVPDANYLMNISVAGADILYILTGEQQ